MVALSSWSLATTGHHTLTVRSIASLVKPIDDGTGEQDSSQKMEGSRHITDEKNKSFHLPFMFRHLCVHPRTVPVR